MAKKGIPPSKVVKLIFPGDRIRDPNPPIGEIGNWTGKLFLFDRKRLIKKNYALKDNLAKPGVYLLLSSTKEKLAIYAGEGEDVLGRVRQQFKKRFWREALVYISRDNDVNKAGIKYLEHKIFLALKKSNLHRIMNRTVPTMPSISAADQAQLDESFDNILFIASRLTGYRF